MHDPRNTGELLLEIRDMMKRLAPFTMMSGIALPDEEPILEEPILIEAAGNYIKKSKHTIYGYIRDAKKELKKNPKAEVFPFHKKSHKGLYFFKSELIAWIQKQKK